MSDLSPSERSMRARLGGLAVHARHGSAVAANARRFGPGTDEYWEALVPESVTDHAERIYQAKLAKRLHFAGLAYKSARARRARRGGS
jgi:hypothetical protein